MEARSKTLYSTRRSLRRLQLITLALLLMSVSTLGIVVYSSIQLKLRQRELSTLTAIYRNTQLPNSTITHANATHPILNFTASEADTAALTVPDVEGLPEIDPEEQRSRRGASHNVSTNNQRIRQPRKTRTGANRSSGVTFTIDLTQTGQCDIRHNLVLPFPHDPAAGWDMNCWKPDENKVDFARSSESDNGISILKDGIYYVYSMLTFVINRPGCLNTSPSVGFAIYQRYSSGKTKILRCISSARCTKEYLVTCFTGKVVRLRSHDFLTVKIQGDLDSVSSVLTNEENSYIGLIRLHGK